MSAKGPDRDESLSESDPSPPSAAGQEITATEAAEDVADGGLAAAVEAEPAESGLEAVDPASEVEGQPEEPRESAQMVDAAPESPILPRLEDPKES